MVRMVIVKLLTNAVTKVPGVMLIDTYYWFNRDDNCAWQKSILNVTKSTFNAVLSTNEKSHMTKSIKFCTQRLITSTSEKGGNSNLSSSSSSIAVLCSDWQVVERIKTMAQKNTDIRHDWRIQCWYLFFGFLSSETIIFFTVPLRSC